jgi:hypothetical protein
MLLLVVASGAVLGNNITTNGFSHPVEAFQPLPEPISLRQFTEISQGASNETQV